MPPLPLALAHNPLIIPIEFCLCIRVGLIGVFSLKYIFLISYIVGVKGILCVKLFISNFRLTSTIITKRCCFKFLTPASYVYSFIINLINSSVILIYPFIPIFEYNSGNKYLLVIIIFSSIVRCLNLIL